jgi:hypothetical protein
MIHSISSFYHVISQKLIDWSEQIPFLEEMVFVVLKIKKFAFLPVNHKYYFLKK